MTTFNMNFVGLASKVNTPTGNTFLPFCAFTLNPQNSIIMTPLENILLVATQQNLQSGNVQAAVAAPGCNFSFTSSLTSYKLMVESGSFQITNVPQTTPVYPVPSGSVIGLVVNNSDNISASRRGHSNSSISPMTQG